MRALRHIDGCFFRPRMLGWEREVHSGCATGVLSRLAGCRTEAGVNVLRGEVESWPTHWNSFQMRVTAS
jgi:hypothetical protein